MAALLAVLSIKSDIAASSMLHSTPINDSGFTICPHITMAHFVTFEPSPQIDCAQVS